MGILRALLGEAREFVGEALDPAALFWTTCALGALLGLWAGVSYLAELALYR
jgi:hypothetical protein